MPDHSLHQSLGQQQTLAPQMRKSLEILQANTLELNQLLREALETNPVLEASIESVSLDAEAPEDEEADSLEYLNETDDDWRDREIVSNQTNPWTTDDEVRRQHLYDSIVAPETLQQHLLQQLELAMVDERIKAAGRAIIANLDPRGFLDLPLTELATRETMEMSTLKAALTIIQSFDPPGVGATGLAESLLLQLAHAGESGTIEHRIVAQHLEDLARKRFPQIARALGTPLERVVEAAERISRLTPNPGGAYDPTGNPYILPDVVIERDDDGLWSAQLTNEHLPNLRINDLYKDLMGASGIDNKTRNFLRDQIRDGRSLIRSIGLRQETILAIAYKLIEHQRDFLEKGSRHLRPLTMNDIADELNMHATTVSRAVAGKYIDTPHGLMEMRAFFATGYQAADGAEVSNAGVREAIQQLIARENPSKPFSDEAITKHLKQQGLQVARRTIAKYREQLNILPSHLRKSF